RARGSSYPQAARLACTARHAAARLPGMTPEISVRSPGELVDATPYVIGFHPADSLVVLGIEDDRVFFGARHDLPPPDGDDIVHLAAVVAAQRPPSIVLLAYGPPTTADPVIER